MNVSSDIKKLCWHEAIDPHLSDGIAGWHIETTRWQIGFGLAKLLALSSVT